jgi:hypothetical protein
MLKTAEIEQMLVEGIRSETCLGRPVDYLLRRLLSGLSSYAGPSTDGVIFEYTRTTGREVMASGVVVMIDGTVEPLRIELTLGESETTLSSGRICFGDSTRTVSYGSREDRKLRNAMLAYPNADYPWKESFHRAGDGWHHEAG